MNSISLSELTQKIQEAIALNFGKPLWIRAEISELRENAKKSNSQIWREIKNSYFCNVILSIKYGNNDSK